MLTRAPSRSPDLLLLAPRGEREGSGAHPLLAEDPVASVRPRHQARGCSRPTATAPHQAGLHHRLQGDGAGRQQGPEGQAAADRQDDGAPLPLLRPRASERREGGCWSGAGSSAAAARSTRSATRSWACPAFRARYGIENRKADGTAPDWKLTAMVMNHYKRPKASTCAPGSTTRPRSAPRCIPW